MVGYMAQSASAVYSPVSSGRSSFASLDSMVSVAPKPLYQSDLTSVKPLYSVSQASFASLGYASSILPSSYHSSVQMSDLRSSSYLASTSVGYLSENSLQQGSGREEDSLDLLAKRTGSKIMHVETDFHPAQFIKARKGGIFVSGAESIQEDISFTFEKLMGEEFPSDIKLSVLSRADFRKICPQSGVVGVSFNRRQFGLVSEIFVLEGSLASVMLTIGHEIGHVLTKTLANPALEEAKAYAFSFAWMDVIRRFNIAGLQDAFVSSLPAANGIHDVGYFFVEKLIREGSASFSVYRDLVMGKYAVAS